MSTPSREDVAHRIVTHLPQFGAWSEAISEVRTPWGKIGYRQLELLWVIRHHLIPDERMTPKAIAAFFQVQPSVVTRIVAKLVERGFVRRVTDPHDARSFWLEVTPLGTDVSVFVEQRHDREVLDAIAHLTDEQISVLSESLDLLGPIGARLLSGRKELLPRATAGEVR